jgi:cell division protein FtsB
MLQAKEQRTNIVKLPVNSQDSRPTNRKRIVKSKKRNRIKIFLGIFIVLLVYSFGGQYIKMYSLQKEIKTLDTQLSEYKSKNQKLEKDIKRMESDVYVERMAREKLGLIKSGEVPIMEAKAAEGKLVEKTKNDEDNVH